MSDYYTYRNKKGYWCARKRLATGDRHFNSKTTNRATYEKRAREWYQNLVAEEFGEAPKPVFEDAVEGFCVGYLVHKKSRTEIRYRGVLFGCIDRWTGKKVNTFTTVDFAK